MNDETVKQLLNSLESDYLDFKQEWHKNTGKLIHDILCLCNSISTNKERYIIFGVKDKDRVPNTEFVDISRDKNRRKDADLQNILEAHLNHIPTLHIYPYKIKDDITIDILKITPLLNDLPYMCSNRGKFGGTIREKVLYSRTGSRNVEIGNNLNIDIVEKIFLIKNGLFGRNN